MSEPHSLTKLSHNTHLHLCNKISNSPDADHAIATADHFALAINEQYRHLQRKLIKKTAKLDIMRCIFWGLLPLVSIAEYTQRAAYLELIIAIGPEIFDTIPDRFGIRNDVVELERIHKRLNDIS